MVLIERRDGTRSGLSLSGELSVHTSLTFPPASTPATLLPQGETRRNSSVDASIRGVNDDHGSVQSIRGIEGINTITLQNLEAVLQMQDRPQEDQGKGGARTAAGLMAREPTDELEEIPDARDVHLEFELEGS